MHHTSMKMLDEYIESYREKKIKAQGKMEPQKEGSGDEVFDQSTAKCVGVGVARVEWSVVED